VVLIVDGVVDNPIKPVLTNEVVIDPAVTVFIVRLASSPLFVTSVNTTLSLDISATSAPASSANTLIPTPIPLVAVPVVECASTMISVTPVTLFSCDATVCPATKIDFVTPTPPDV